MTTCAFVPCDEAAGCALSGGCVKARFGFTAAPGWVALPKRKALNGTKPRPSRDPRFIKRNRKPLGR